MNKDLFGLRGSITPNTLLVGLVENWEQENIHFELSNSVLEITHTQKDQEKRAKELAELYILAWNFVHNTKIDISFNHHWEPKNDETTIHNIAVNDSVQIHDRIIIHKVSAEIKAKIVGKSDSDSVLINRELVEKTLRNNSLKKAIEYYSNEVLNSENPQYGIYKAIEELTKELGVKRGNGRVLLAQLANKNKLYVDEIMETTQNKRHARTPARNLLSEQECKQRAKILIEAYAQNL